MINGENNVYLWNYEELEGSKCRQKVSDKTEAGKPCNVNIIYVNVIKKITRLHITIVNKHKQAYAVKCLCKKKHNCDRKTQRSIVKPVIGLKINILYTWQWMKLSPENIEIVV